MDKNKWLRICVLAGSLFLSGCASTADRPAEAGSQAPANSLETSTRFTTGLPSQSLEPNECGLFLWSANDISKFVFYTRAGQTSALVYLDGETTELEILRRDGDVFGQFFTDYVFSTGAGTEVSLSYTPGDELTDGARIRSGNIQHTNSEGWRTVLPVLGARVCQPIVTAPSSVRSKNSAG